MSTKTPMNHEQKPDSTNQTMSDTERTREIMLKAEKHALENRDPKTAWVALGLKRYLEKTADMEE